MPRIGFCCGAFDLLHPGHILMLKDAKDQCDYLIVGLQTDPSIDRPGKNKPIQTIYERFVMLHSIVYVDEIYVYETEKDLMALLQLVSPDIRILGSDWMDDHYHYTGEDLGIPIHWHNRRERSWSTSSLRQRVVDRETR